MRVSGPTALLFIDDSGSRNPDHLPEARTDRLDWFALGGIMVDAEDVRVVLDLHKAFVESWGLEKPLHSTRIRGRRNEFSWLGRDAVRAEKFYRELRDLLVTVPVMGIACVIDRPGYNARYRDKYGTDRWLMCKTAYAILLERAAKHALIASRQLEVFFEEAGRREDRNLQSYHKAIKAEGMPFDSARSGSYDGLGPTDFQKVVLGDPNRQTKANPLIQIADLYLYPIVKGGYDSSYQPYSDLLAAERIIDATIPPEEIEKRGVKYSCFDLVKGEGPDR